MLTSVSLEPFNAPLTGWIMPWPLFYFSERFKSSIPRLFLAGAACSLFFCIFTFYWITDLFKNFAGMGTVASLAAFIPFSTVFNLQIPAFVLLSGISLRDRYRTNLKPRWLIAGTFALICDYCIPKLFPYHWGNFVAGNPYIVQVADITGIHGLTFLVFAVSCFLYRLLHRIILELNGRACGTNRLSALKRILEAKSLKRFWPVPLLFFKCHRHEEWIKIESG
jgi:apolipoprotein N-acyltransferase